MLFGLPTVFRSAAWGLFQNPSYCCTIELDLNDASASGRFPGEHSALDIKLHSNAIFGVSIEFVKHLSPLIQH